MRTIRLAVLGLVAAASLMALVGPSAASAEIHEGIGFCKLDELLLCQSTNLIPVNSGLLLAKAENPVLEGTINEKCKTSKARVNLIPASKLDTKKIDIEVSELTFAECEPCTVVTVEGLPLLGELTMSAVGEGGTWKLHSKGNAKFTGCPLGVSCRFGTEGTEPDPFIEMTSTEPLSSREAILNTNKTLLTRSEGSKLFCGETGNWNAKYKLRWTLFAAGDTNHVTPLGEHTVFPTLLEAVG